MGCGVCRRACLVPGCCGMGWACVPLVPGLALHWPAGVCVCAYGLRACWPAGAAATGKNPRLSPAQIGGTVSATCRNCCPADRWPDLLPVLLPCMSGADGICAHNVREWPGHYGGGFGPAAGAGSGARCTEKTRKFYRKIPTKKRPQKILQKISPYGGTVCTRKIFAKSGLTAALNRAML